MSRYSVQRGASALGRANLMDGDTVLAYVQRRPVADGLAELLNRWGLPPSPVVGERVREPRPVMVQRLRAPELDPNGNTVAAWVFMDAGGYVLDVIHQGPEGKPATARHLLELPDVVATEAEVLDRLGLEWCQGCGGLVGETDEAGECGPCRGEL